MNSPSVIVVGGTVAALMAALRFAQSGLAQSGFAVQLLSPLPARRSYPRGEDGLNVALDPLEEQDSVRCHFEDTIRAGHFLACQGLVRRMCELAPRLAQLLSSYGVLFHRHEDGTPKRIQLAGATHPRTLFSGVQTGQNVLAALDGQLRGLATKGCVARLEGWQFLSLARDEQGQCRGVVACHRQTMEIQAFGADAVILATPGPVLLYGKNSTASLLEHGAEMSVVYQQGATLANLEFVHFHPACVADSDKMVPVSPFALEPENVGKKRPGLGPAEAAAAHRFLGGLWLDQQHMTTIPGLFAAGECLAGYHGAQALAGNFLLSDLASGFQAGWHARQWVQGRQPISPAILQRILEREAVRQRLLQRDILSCDGLENPHQLYAELTELMCDNVGEGRVHIQLKAMEDKLERLERRARRLGLSDRSSFCNEELIFVWALRNMLVMARAVGMSARYRDESRGMHRRLDFPGVNDEMFLKTTKVCWTPTGPRVAYQDVEMSSVTNRFAGEWVTNR